MQIKYTNETQIIKTHTIVIHCTWSLKRYRFTRHLYTWHCLAKLRWQIRVI